MFYSESDRRRQWRCPSPSHPRSPAAPALLVPDLITRRRLIKSRWLRWRRRGEATPPLKMDGGSWFQLPPGILLTAASLEPEPPAPPRPSTTANQAARWWGQPQMSPIKFILQPKKTAVNNNNNKNKSRQAGRSTLGKIHNGNNLVNMEAEPSARRGHAAFSSPRKLTREINIKAIDDDRRRGKKKNKHQREKKKIRFHHLKQHWALSFVSVVYSYFPTLNFSLDCFI